MYSRILVNTTQNEQRGLSGNKNHYFKKKKNKGRKRKLIKIRVIASLITRKRIHSRAICSLSVSMEKRISKLTKDKVGTVY